MWHILGEIYNYQVKKQTHLKQRVYGRVLDILSSVLSRDKIYLSKTLNHKEKKGYIIKLTSDMATSPALPLSPSRA